MNAVYGVTKGNLLRNESNGTCPRREHVQRLHQRRADHGADGVTGSAGPAGRLKVRDQIADFGGVDQCLDLLCAAGRVYVGLGYWSASSSVLTPGGCNLARVIFFLCDTPILNLG